MIFLLLPLTALKCFVVCKMTGIPFLRVNGKKVALHGTS